MLKVKLDFSPPPYPTQIDLYFLTTHSYMHVYKAEYHYHQCPTTRPKYVKTIHFNFCNNLPPITILFSNFCFKVSMYTNASGFILILLVVPLMVLCSRRNGFYLVFIQFHNQIQQSFFCLLNCQCFLICDFVRPSFFATFLRKPCCKTVIFVLLYYYKFIIKSTKVFLQTIYLLYQVFFLFEVTNMMDLYIFFKNMIQNVCRPYIFHRPSVESVPPKHLKLLFIFL